jgi:protein TonB
VWEPSPGLSRGRWKEAGRGWKKFYRFKVEIGLALSLLVVISLLRLPIISSDAGLDLTLSEQELVQLEEIQPTRQLERAPPPPRPPVPIEVADDVILEDESLDLDATLDIGAVSDIPSSPPPPPKPLDGDEEDDAEPEIFVIVEEMPTIIGGIAKVYEYLEYPEIARQARMEGLVIINLVVEPDGSGSEYEVTRSAGSLLDEAAMTAVRKLRFNPGKQRMKPVRVRLAVPIRFRLVDLSRR